MLAKESWRFTISALMLSLLFLPYLHGNEISGIATQSGELDGQYTEDSGFDDTPLQAEYVFELEKPLLPMPLAEEMPVSRPRIRPKLSRPQPRNSYRYYYKREEIEEHEGPRTIKKALDALYQQHYKQHLAEMQEKSGAKRPFPDRFAPNMLEAESVSAHLKETKESTIREACRNNLRLIASAVDSYFRDYPDEIIKSFNQDDVTSLNGRFVKNGYLKEPIKIPEGCRYVNEHRLSELISGSQIYCTRHDKP